MGVWMRWKYKRGDPIFKIEIETEIEATADELQDADALAPRIGKMDARIQEMLNKNFI